MEYICRKCGEDIADVAEAMVNGCICGAKVFRQVKTTDNSEDTIEEIQEISDKEETVKNEEVNIKMEDEIAILIKDKGKYQVNIENLMKRKSGSDPIFVKNKNGVINVLFNPDT